MPATLSKQWRTSVTKKKKKKKKKNGGVRELKRSSSACV
jgi:hypothetical protein